MSTIHVGTAFGISLVAAVALGFIALWANPHEIIDVPALNLSAVAVFLPVTLALGALCWFGPCRSKSQRRRVYGWFVAIANIAAFGLMAAAWLRYVAVR